MKMKNIFILKIRITFVFLFLLSLNKGYSQCSISVVPTNVKCKGESTGSATATVSGIPNPICTTLAPSNITCSSCTKTLTGSTSYTLNSGEKGCITSGSTFSGLVTMNGGTLVVCGTANLSGINFNTGNIYVLSSGTFKITNFNVNPNCNFYNYGTTTVTNMTATSGRLENHKNFTVSSGYNVNGPSNLLNTCNFNVGLDFIVDNIFVNKGKITVPRNSTVNGSGTVQMFPGSSWITSNLIINGKIEGDVNTCSKISISGETRANSSAILTGRVDVCDANGIEVQNGSWASLVTTNCTCTAGGSTGTGMCSFVWKEINAQGAVIRTLTGINGTVQNLKAGTYQVTATCPGCSSPQNSNFTITEPSIEKPSVQLFPVNVSSTGACDGFIDVTPSGGTLPYQYLWQDGSQQVPRQNVCAGNYLLQITDANGCKGVGSTSVGVGPTETCNIDLTVVDACIGKIGGTISTDPGGNGSNQGCATTVQSSGVSCASGCTKTFSGSASGTLSAGQTGCIQQGTTYTGTLALSGGKLIVCGSYNPSAINFTGGEIVITETGSANFPNINMNNVASSVKNFGILKASSFTFNGIYENHKTTEITNDFNVNSGAKFYNFGLLTVLKSFNNNSIASNKGAMNMGIDFKNNGGATFTNECTINVTGEFHNNAIFTNKGTINANAYTRINGGSTLTMADGSLIQTANLVVNALIKGGTLKCAAIKISSTTIVNSAASFSGLLDLCDANGIETLNVTLPATVTTNCSCSAGGSGSGGGSGTPGTCLITIVNQSTGVISTSNGGVIDSLPPGTYRVNVDCGNNCRFDTVVVIKEKKEFCPGEACDSSRIAVVSVDKHVSCEGNHTGKLRAVLCDPSKVSGYDLIWTRNNTEVGYGVELINVQEGTYTLTIKDKITKEVLFIGSETILFIPDPKGTCPPFDCNTFSVDLVLEKTPTSATSCDGILVAEVSGAVGEVTYEWRRDNVLMGGVTGTIFLQACPGVNYSVKATIVPVGQEICEKSDNVTPGSGPGGPDPDCSTFNAVSGPVQNITCFGNSDGNASVIISGGSGSYQSIWEHSDHSTILNGPVQADLRKGTWTVTVTDTRLNCPPKIVTITIVEPLPLNPQIEASNGIICNTGSGVTIAITNPNSGYTYQWSSPALGSGPTVQATQAGSYWVTVTLGICKATSNIVTLSKQPNDLDISSNGGVVCPERKMVVKLSSPINTGNTWSTTAPDPDNKINGNTSRIITATHPGTYTLTVNFSGCSPLSASLEVLQDCNGGPIQCHPQPFPNFPVTNNCERHIVIAAIGAGKIKYQKYIEDLKRDFKADYINKCLTVYEELNVKYNDFGNYHHTLYYYDQVGNLIRTVPPIGVTPITSSSDLEDVKEDRKNNTRGILTDHSYTSTFQYNSLNQPMGQSIPDHDPFQSWEVSAGGTGIETGITLTDVHYFDENNGYAIGGNGTDGSLYYTTDGGKTWKKANALGVDDINDVQYIVDGTIYAVADQGIFLKSVNNGVTWNTINTGSKKNLIKLHFFNQTSGLVMEEDGTIWKSSNAGATFTISNSLKNILIGSLTEVSFSGSNVGIASSRNGGRGYVYYTSDAGVSWEESNSIAATTLTASYMMDENNMYASGPDGLLVKTTDGGQTWRITPSASTDNFSTLHFYTQNSGAALLTNGLLKTTANGGTSWTTQSGLYKKMSFSDPRNGFLVSDQNLLQSTNGGQAWDIVATTLDFPWSQVYQIQAIDDRTLYFTRKIPTLLWNQVIKFDVQTRLFTHIGYGITSHTYKEIELTTDRRGVFLTTLGELYRVNVGAGATFSSGNLQLVSLGGQPVLDIFFPSTTRGYAINSVGGFYSTIDGGINWSARTSVGGGQVQNIYFSSTSDGIAVGNDGRIYVTNNGGFDWTVQTGNIRPVELKGAVMATATTGYVVGGNGDVYKTTNGGSSWQKQTSFSTGDLQAVDAAAGNLAVAVSSTNQDIYTNTGTSWTLGSVISKVSKAVSYPGSNTAYSAGSSGVVLKSVNGGASWTSQTSSTTENLNAIDFVNTLRGVSVGDNAVVITTANGGTTWTKLSNILPKQLNASSSIGNAIYAVGNEGALMKSIDGGKSWAVLNSQTTANLYGVDFTSESTGFIVGAGGLIRFTNDGGSTWTTQATGTTADLKDVYVNGSFGIAVGNSGVILRFNSGSGNWSSVASPTTQGLSAVYYVNASLGFIVGNNGVILKSTTNNGTGWTSKLFQQSPPVDWTTHFYGSARNLKDVYFTDSYIGYVVGNSGTVLRTDDAGETWNQESASTTQNLEAISAKGNNSIAIAGAGSFSRSVTDETFAELTTRYWYDQKGRLIVSQDAEQHNRTPVQAYNYTKYDELDRIIEIGEVTRTEPAPVTVEGNYIAYQNYLLWLQAGTKKEITKTFYDYQQYFEHGYDQENLYRRVASIVLLDEENSSYSKATHYSYDIHGNVKRLIHDNPGLSHLEQQFKVIEYRYDLISSKVNELHYQPGQADQFYYRFRYDSDSRPTMAETSKDGVLWEKDFKYFYYPHSLLSRAELGDTKVQGIDFAYTINGWNKGINSNTLKTNRDIGKDANAGGVNQLVAADAFGYSMGYYKDDYKSIENIAQAQHFIAATTGSPLDNPDNDLFNGNISHTIAANRQLMPGNESAPLGMMYKYDQLDRLTSSASISQLDQNSNQWLNGALNQDYNMNISYDANGNITSLKRNSFTGNGHDNKMDNLQYIYETKQTSFARNTNRLIRITDSGDNSVSFGDIRSGQTGLNYQYDETGQLIKDEQEEIKEVTWTTYEKVKTIVRKDNSTLPDLEFEYDASQNRCTKIVKPRKQDGSGLTTQDNWIYTYYVRDPSGQVILTYERTFSKTGTNTFTESLKAEEYSIYSSKRMGVYKYNQEIASATFTATYSGLMLNPSSLDVSVREVPDSIIKYAGIRSFELTNHSNDVVSVITDREIPVSTDMLTVSSFKPEIIQANNYYPYGMIIPNENNLTSSNSYRYGFNGMEKDDEVKGNGNSYSTEFRFYDPRVGRWLSLDPLMHKYPNISPYAAFNNNPIYFVDPQGDDPEDAIRAQYVQKLVDAGIEFAEEVNIRVKVGDEWVNGIADLVYKDKDGKFVPVEFKGEVGADISKSYTDPQKKYIPALEQGAEWEVAGKGTLKKSKGAKLAPDIGLNKGYKQKGGFGGVVHTGNIAKAVSRFIPKPTVWRYVREGGKRVLKGAADAGGKALAVVDFYGDLKDILWVIDPFNPIMGDSYTDRSGVPYVKDKKGNWVREDVYKKYGEDWQNNIDKVDTRCNEIQQMWYPQRCGSGGEA